MKGISLRNVVITAVILLGPIPAQPPATPLPQASSQESLVEQALGAERRGEVARAAELYLKLFEANPANPEWAIAAGRCLGLVGRYNDAMDLLDQQRDRFPDVVELRAMLARTFLLKAESIVAEGIRDLNVELYLRDAVSTSEEILTKAPGHRDSRLIAAQALLELGEQDKALDHAEEAARRFPDHPGGHILVGRISFQRFATLRTTIIQDRPTGQVQADLIQRAYDERERARKALETAIEVDPNRSYPHRMLGDLQSWIGNPLAAMAHYKRALIVDPATAINHAWLSENVDVDERIAFYREAADGYRRNTGGDPARASILDWYIGRAWMEKESWDQAQSSFEQVLKSRPEDTGSLYYAMLTAYWSGDLDAAESHAAAHAQLTPAGFADLIRALPEPDQDDVLGILSSLARRSYDAERLEPSRHLNRVLAYVINTASHWNNYAFLCRETGQLEDSLAAYQTALQLEPDSPQLLNDAGVVLQYHLTSPENLERARGFYNRAIASAEEILRAGDADPEALARARQAMQDARLNLEKLSPQRDEQGAETEPSFL